MNKFTDSTAQMVWHYTKLKYLSDIEDDGHLIPKSEAEVYKGASQMGYGVSQTAFIWFSSNQNFEPLCTQLGGGLRKSRLTWQQLCLEHGAMRFGISHNDPRLLNYKETCAIGGANRQERRDRERMAEKARKLGSDVSGWYTSTQPLPITDLKLELWIGGEWK